MPSSKTEANAITQLPLQHGQMPDEISRSRFRSIGSVGMVPKTSTRRSISAHLRSPLEREQSMGRGNPIALAIGSSLSSDEIDFVVVFFAGFRHPELPHFAVQV